MATFTLTDAQKPENLLLECLFGSRAYGTATPTSDEDIKGIFILPKDQFLGQEAVPQVQDEKHDTVYFEIGRFVELLGKSNPTILELLFAPEDSMRFRSPLLDHLRVDHVLSKEVEKTFALYAAAQIKKARGLKKKIVNPMPERRKTLPEFCYALNGQGSQAIQAWLDDRSWHQEDCGLVRIPHMRDVYGLYHGPGVYRGCWKGPDPTGLLTSSVPKEAKPDGWIAVNMDAFKRHCREHREYWEWVALRNEARFQVNQEHDRGYDSKNLMHTFRLLDMAEEVAREGRLHVRRPNRAFLLEVRAGKFAYEALLQMAEKRLADVRAAFSTTSLPDTPNASELQRALVSIRAEHYGIT